eukprot:CAMPEP_0119190446 /NCGR_PEP_ID=MMETSP1316-20130426/1527_1 /TAXON_ID=41880 /ORGANISM="Pycnococcus provasolii, Strain RCC2336" /LENGTH=165 /DNA_ID=CAMNT_0007185313 /DNA_START=102 /DNA_END=599 /DNA_ORIENTATION=-
MELGGTTPTAPMRAASARLVVLVVVVVVVAAASTAAVSGWNLLLEAYSCTTAKYPSSKHFAASNLALSSRGTLVIQLAQVHETTTDNKRTTNNDSLSPLLESLTATVAIFVPKFTSRACRLRLPVPPALSAFSNVTRTCAPSRDAATTAGCVGGIPTTQTPFACL